MPTNVYLYEHRQLYDDWTVQPFVDIILEPQNIGCPSDYEALFHKVWNGTYEVCVEKFEKSESNIGYNFITGTECDGNVRPGLAPVNMTSIDGMVACGKRGGPNFVDTVRVDPVTLKCPGGYEPCSYETNPSETVCLSKKIDKSQCPILDIVIISE